METRPAGNLEKWGKYRVYTGKQQGNPVVSDPPENQKWGICGLKDIEKDLESLNKSELIAVVLSLIRNLNTAFLETLNSIIEGVKSTNPTEAQGKEQTQ